MEDCSYAGSTQPSGMRPLKKTEITNEYPEKIMVWFGSVLGTLHTEQFGFGSALSTILAMQYQNQNKRSSTKHLRCLPSVDKLCFFPDEPFPGTKKKTETKAADKLFGCPLCNYTSYRIFNMRRHIRSSTTLSGFEI